ncbi:MAG: D-alanine--D-alanine ligase [Candidatus Omnitrophica bacterium]|nr:D-alanine--D-alanine ligase [Candidatus Omnitrophota bacterium]
MGSEFGRVGILMGGSSSERAISLRSGMAAYHALTSLGIDCVSIDVVPDHAGFRKQIALAHIDVAFIALHGAFGEDGTAQTLLDQMHIPYTGSGAAASRCAIDKVASKYLFEEQGIVTPRAVVFNCELESTTGLERYTLGDIPGLLRGWGDVSGYVIKPACQGSSIGVTMVREMTRIPEAIEKALAFGDRIVIEEMISGRELTVGILEESALPVIEVIPGSEFYDYDAKYSNRQTQYRVPAPLTPEEGRLIQGEALKAHRALQCCGFSRVDLIYSLSGVPYILEVNTIPGLTDRSLLPRAAEAQGVPFPELCRRMLHAALRRHHTLTRLVAGGRLVFESPLS